PSRAETRKRRIRILLELGRPDEALCEAGRQLSANPNDPETLELIGLCCLRRRDFTAALDALGRAIAAAPESAHPHYLYGFALRESGRIKDAESPYRRALELDPDEPIYLRATAELLADLG